MKFKVGDLVIGNKAARIYIHTKPRIILKVTRVNPLYFAAQIVLTGEVYSCLNYNHFDLYKRDILKTLKHFIDQIMRGLTAGLPEWYKEQLLKHQFEGEITPE